MEFNQCFYASPLKCYVVKFDIHLLLEKRERIEFAVTVNKYDRRFKVGCCFWDSWQFALLFHRIVFNLGNVCMHSVCSESELTFFTGNEAGPSVIKQTHLPHWKRKGKYGQRKKQRKKYFQGYYTSVAHPTLSYAYCGYLGVQCSPCKKCYSCNY